MTVATLNLGARGARHSLHIVADVGAVLIGCQEASDKRTDVATFAAQRGWSAHHPGAKVGQAATPIVWDPNRVHITRAGAARAVRRRFVGPGAGPTFSKPKWLVWVRDDRDVTYISTHFVASVRRNVMRRRHHARHVAQLLKFADTCPGPVVVLTDLNAPPDFKGDDPLRAAGFTGWHTLPTLRDGTIDYVLARDAAVGGHRAVGTRSDHRALIATVRP